MGLFDLFKNKPKEENESADSESKVSFEVLRDDGVRAMKMGEVDFATKCFTAALEMKDDLTTLSYLAEAQIRMQEYAKARPTLEKLVEQAPENVTIHLLLAKTLGELKDFAAMKATAQNALALDADSVSAKYYLADASFRLGDPFNAIALLTQVIQKQPDFADARSLRARILCGMYQYQDALEDTTALAETEPENEEYQLQHAGVLEALEKNEEAEATLKKMIEYNPFNRDAILNLANLYDKMSLHDKALQTLDEAIEMQPDFAKAYKMRGGIKLHLKDQAGAAEDLKKSLELEPEIANQIEGEFSTLENKMNERYKNMNPYGF